MTNREHDELKLPSPQDEIGYAKPPMVRRFKDSGNAGGRPKGAKNLKTIVQAVANEAHTVIENGKQRRLTTWELVILCLRQKALEGKDLRAFDEFRRLHKTYRPDISENECGYLVAPATLTPEEWIARAEIHNREADARHEKEMEEDRLLQNQG